MFVLKHGCLHFTLCNKTYYNNSHRLESFHTT